ncbi:Fe-S cluster assembly sulfur transfer protein SufU [Euzebya tangerina]|uniref:Fe-S cluster assembly sulfur transfer protein SufU n=1 Tax=Euzebya tangerina TaxID=591198 RepID=UPI000E3145B5|nr:SUF system NifU family Fe-S cluster assembly protein [Euzebya tangerina]
MSLDDLYQEIILDHYKKPRNRAPDLEPHHVHVHHSNPLCGDEMDLRLRIGGEVSETVDAVVYDGDGCSISMASASAMTEAVVGRTLDDAEDLAEAFRLMMHGEDLRREEDLVDGVAFQGVAKFPVRVKCALLGWMALKDAIATHRAGSNEHEVTHD